MQAAMQSGDEVNKEEEFGDLLFALVNAARLYGVNAETALEKCNKKFISRLRNRPKNRDCRCANFRLRRWKTGGVKPKTRQKRKRNSYGNH